MNHGAAVVEALLFAARKPLELSVLAEAAGLSYEQARESLVELAASYRERGAGVEVVEVAGGYQVRTRKEFAAHIRELLSPEPHRLSTAALEVAAIVACKQPVTRAEIEAVRGVSSDSALKTLLELGLVTELGRKDTPGRPFLYGTTERFLQEFGLGSLDELAGVLEQMEEAEVVQQIELFQTGDGD